MLPSTASVATLPATWMVEGPRALIEDELRRHPRIRTPQDHREGMLLLRAGGALRRQPFSVLQPSREVVGVPFHQAPQRRGCIELEVDLRRGVEYIGAHGLTS
jgi:hypothetical protein